MIRILPPSYDSDDNLPEYSSGTAVYKNARSSSQPEIAVELDAPHATYAIGDIVTGRIALAPRTDLSLASITVLLQGEEVAPRASGTVAGAAYSHGACARTTFVAGVYTVPRTLFPENRVVRRKRVYVFPFSVQIQPRRLCTRCDCPTVHHANLPPSLGDNKSTENDASVSTVSVCIGNRQQNDVLGCKAAAVEYRVAGRVRHLVGDRELVLSTSRQAQPSIRLMASYLPTATPTKSKLLSLGETLCLQIPNHNAIGAVACALVSRTSYSTGLPATEFSVPLLVKSWSRGRLEVGLPAARVADGSIVPSFHSCLIRREYSLKIRVTGAHGETLHNTPVHVVPSISVPLSAAAIVPTAMASAPRRRRNSAPKRPFLSLFGPPRIKAAAPLAEKNPQDHVCLVPVI